MERSIFALVLVSMLAAAQVACGAEFTVGENSGWTFQVNYTQWASPKTFRVGDILSFPYTGVHNVLEVSKAEYDSCDASKALQTYAGASPIKVTLSRSGEHWFICGIPGHCDAGMKLPVNVQAGAVLTPAPRASAPAPPRRARSAPPPSSLAVSPSPAATPFRAPSPSTSRAPSTRSPSPLPSVPLSPTQDTSPAPELQSPPTIATPPTFATAPASPPNSSAFPKVTFGWLAAAVSGFILILV